VDWPKIYQNTPSHSPGWGKPSQWEGPCARNKISNQLSTRNWILQALRSWTQIRLKQLTDLDCNLLRDNKQRTQFSHDNSNETIHVCCYKKLSLTHWSLISFTDSLCHPCFIV
jgi:hypothetical protein